MSKCLSKYISTKVSFKISTSKGHVYIDIGWLWILNQCFYLEIRNDDRTKMIVLPLFQLATLLKSQNTNETEFINELWHIKLFTNIGISNWHNWSLDPTKMKFLNFFQFLTRLLTASTWNVFVHTSRCKIERCEKRAFQLLKMRKKKITWNIKPNA